jgi:hypothetical protein
MHCKFKYRIILIGAIGLTICAATAQPVWDVKTYPDESGYQQRIQGMLPKLAAKDFGERSKSPVRCPDTQLTFYTWALEGEEIISPYTGRKFKQGPTGYFGAKQRDSLGRISAFGGDPLKYDLPPATAALLLDSSNAKAKHFLSIPGNLRQQYHFAAKNWVRFYGLTGHNWHADWQSEFQQAIATYAESRRPSDGARENAPMSIAHNLVGERGHLLGGNKKDGGTENHKTMWRTSALLYGEWFPATGLVSGVPVPEAARLTDSMLNDYVKRLAVTGNGEYDSQIYYPHSIGAFLNVFDFTKSEQSKTMAQAALDYYLATYGLKVYDGTIAGAQKRGYLPGQKPGEMEMYLWTWGAHTSRLIPKEEQQTTLHQLTSTYRPNQVIMNILNKQVPLPYEAFMNRPFYHMDVPAQFNETFYASKSFGLGSVAMSAVDNPTQQVVWSLVANGTRGPLAFGAMQPRFLNPAGHSPYTQTLQKKGAIIIATDATTANMPLNPSPSQKQRMAHATEPLEILAPPDSSTNLQAWTAWMEQSKKSAATWFFMPKEINELVENEKGIFAKANETYIYIKPLGVKHFWLKPKNFPLDSIPEKHPLKILAQYRVLVSSGRQSGFVVEVAEASEYDTMEKFITAVTKRTSLNTTRWASKQQIGYISLGGDNLWMQYEPADLRCSGSINGKPIDYANWANGAVYESPYVKIKGGLMQFNDGKAGYLIDCRGERPVFKPWEGSIKREK